eukprot:Em0019g184a
MLTSDIWHIPRTSLSPHVSYLLTRSVPQSAPPYLPNIFTDDCTLEWSVIPLTTILTKKDEFVDGVMKLGVIAKSVSAELSSHNVEAQLLKVLPSAFDWTPSPELFVRCVHLLLIGDPCANLLSCLLCCAGLERALGDVFLSASKANQCPSLLRDLLATKELENVFGAKIMCLLRCLLGHPLGLNVRNVLWHGFMAPQELPKEYAYLLPVVVGSLGKRLNQYSAESNKATKSSCPFKPSHRPYLSLDDDSMTLFPVVADLELDTVKHLFCHSTFILPSMLPIWLAAVKAVQEKRSGEALALLLPCMEHSLRRVFACVNGCPERAITAEATVLYTTFDEILSPYLPDGSPNRLEEEIGASKLEMLLDLLVHPEGPKLRAKISHGEVDFSCVPQAFANHVLCMAITFCAQYTRQPELNKSPIVSRCLDVEKQYVSLFHPISLLRKELLQLVNNLEQWKQIPDNPDKFSITDQSESSGDAISHVLQSVSSLQNTEDAGLPSQLKACLVKGTALNPLQDLITHLWQRPFGTLYVPRADLELVGLLRSIVSNASLSICQVTTTAAERSEQLKRMELRARQRSNYDRLLSSVVVYHQAMVAVVLLVCDSVSQLPLDSGSGQGHIKFLKKVLQFSENFNSLTSPDKNRWAEAGVLCHTLDTRHMTRPECHMFRMKIT